ncbi:hypothetical protein ILUMI_22517 [Ignelater luminosus]|uniref:Peptidase S1 domain-containing protein n=1 Tax=Ignelater luminosus TaxID=2038154 RepID=A0A8K0CGY9_IGNLU|nr:hypothetical protein ILUMI_22517 [Ignelater luminosus]
MRAMFNSEWFIFLIILNFVLATPPPPNPFRTPLIEKNPFLIRIHFYVNSEKSHYCGGSIISQDYILTSADCLDYGSSISRQGSEPPPRFRQLRIVAGSNDLEAGGSLYLADSEFYPEGYKVDPINNNIALVKVKPSFRLGPEIKPARLRESPIQENSDVYFAGWRSFKKYHEGDPHSQTLQEIKLKVMSSQECQNYHDQLNRNQLCTISYIGQGLCRGHEGGPLIIRDPENEIFAVATKEYSCGSGFPEVYTKIEPFIKWINETCKCI